MMPWSSVKIAADTIAHGERITASSPDACPGAKLATDWYRRPGRSSTAAWKRSIASGMSWT
ncbi:MAG: hypothetical protein U0414_39320 [Polyangiaceae bacterium]